ncbi:MAG: PAS domain S-box protein [Bacillota bacterium]|nr:PAS domain S-box protein [Bacillota bacterium]
MEVQLVVSQTQKEFWLLNHHPAQKVISFSKGDETHSSEHEISHQLASILTSISDPLVVIDQEWRFSFLNKLAEELLPFSVEELLGKSVWELFPGYQDSEAALQAEQAMQQKIVIYTRILIKEYGKWIDLSMYPYDSGLTIFCYPDDNNWSPWIADYYGETFYRVFRTNPHVMGICTLKDGRYLDVNDSFVRNAGYTRREVINSTNLNMPFCIDKDRLKEIYRAVNVRGSIKNYELAVNTRTGDVRIGLFSAEKVVIEGEPCMLFLMIDVTERNRIEDSLRKSAQRFRKIFNTSQNMMSLSRCIDSRYIDVNDSWVKHAGFTRQEVLGKTPLELNLIFDPKDMDKIERTIAEQGNLDNFECRYRAKNGEIRMALISMDSIEIDKQQCVISVLTDVTEKKHLERELEKLERFQLIGEMAASIAHEIRNPLTTVRGFLQMFAEDNEKQPDNLHLVLEELDRANAIISEYLSLADQHKMKLEKRDLNQILVSVYPSLYVRASMDGKTVILEQGDISRGVMVDDGEIRQMVINLVNNGLDVTPCGGQVTIRTFMEQGDVILSVSDQGEGMEPEMIERIGVPFFFNKYNTTGWGLAVCYKIAMYHNAVINVSSSPGGTTFLVRFKR